jgi:hypothetical protein
LEQKTSAFGGYPKGAMTFHPAMAIEFLIANQ